MLDGFILSNREAILARVRARVASRASPAPSEAELTHGIPVFLDQLGEALRLAQASEVLHHDQIGTTAAKHGRDLLRMGFTIAQVVHDYGDVCQVITALALEQKAPISGEEFRTLNLCLDDAIADAVTAYSGNRESDIEAMGTERLGVFAHELRNLVTAATLAFDMIRRGVVAPGGSTSAMVARNLDGLRSLVDRSLVSVRLEAGMEHVERIPVAEFLEEIEIGAVIQAQARGVHVVVTSVDSAVTIEGDRQILAGAIANLLQNAFKFTRQFSNVSLRVRATEDRVVFEVEDECGGLPPGSTEHMFLPFSQLGSDRSGVGLGLSIGLKAAKEHGGELRVRDLPGKGCVFTLDLPRKPPPPLTVVKDKKTVASAPDAGVEENAKGDRRPKGG